MKEQLIGYDAVLIALWQTEMWSMSGSKFTAKRFAVGESASTDVFTSATHLNYNAYPAHEGGSPWYGQDGGGTQWIFPASFDDLPMKLE